MLSFPFTWMTPSGTLFATLLSGEGIPYQWSALNDLIPDAVPSRCVRNFRIAAGLESGTHEGFVFQDSDLYKWIEGAAYSLSWHPDPELEKKIDSAVSLIAAAQQPDGYLDTYYIIGGLENRWTNLRDHHELYCAGHLIEAAVAYFQITGKRALLEVALRLVNHIDSVIGPEEGKLHGYPGHPIIEMALMRLYDVTRDPAHLRLAKYLIDERGRTPLFFDLETRNYGHSTPWKSAMAGYRYYQAHEPLREQRKAVGHAVRAVYLYSGMADVARETGDATLAEACRRLWENLTEHRMYVTGAIGSSEYGEGFTLDDDLPNSTIYGETCAAIGLVFFARRMLRLEARGEY
ncbi:MAG: glycoside hydrolase family 127 protein, partial [Clostridia bacterium]|nr:glycoside hydrolase family 127 protein [Clostridia bacterium]